MLTVFLAVEIHVHPSVLSAAIEAVGGRGVQGFVGVAIRYADRPAVLHRAGLRHRLEQNIGGSTNRVAAQAGQTASTMLCRARRASQRSVKFIRWLRHALLENLTEATSLDADD